MPFFFSCDESLVLLHRVRCSGSAPGRTFQVTGLVGEQRRGGLQGLQSLDQEDRSSLDFFVSKWAMEEGCENGAALDLSVEGKPHPHNNTGERGNSLADLSDFSTRKPSTVGSGEKWSHFQRASAAPTAPLREPIAGDAVGTLHSVLNLLLPLTAIRRTMLAAP